MNIAFDLMKVTEAAAIEAAKWVGTGRKRAGDGAAVAAMRKAFSNIDLSGRVVIGEGEKDEAPMLYTGEEVGNGQGLAVDIAVDPVEGTNLMALGRPNAIAVLGASPRGSMYDPGPSYYMNKLVVPKAAAQVVDIDAPVEDNLDNTAKALGKAVRDLVIFVLDKPRHVELIRRIRAKGARVQLHTDGDVAGSLMAVTPGSGVDMMMGTGGTPEGVISACAVVALGGAIFGRLDPKTEEERKAVIEYGTEIDRVLTTTDLVDSEKACFVATGISGGTFLAGVENDESGIITHSMVLDGGAGHLCMVRSVHTNLG
ncbi:fructose-1,6-bisphosphatase [Desulfoluna limicola]|uniref:Fructose-1,6-bisphosphatase n=1 Tax=Desulfoluna limicola TaxID=2810562 RepID=A0ABM7PBY5_9BACT|nr:class II fructose-bisphosphatase [Desulfoluna limicola]BCS94581.1 fructose-1,6-bisphosphatase [Desulfoluna limicola]